MVAAAVSGEGARVRWEKGLSACTWGPVRKTGRGGMSGNRPSLAVARRVLAKVDSPRFPC